MKKFLFTLAAILMAGSMCAGEYFVCQDFEIPQDKIGKNVNIDVKAHFDAYVSAWLTEIYLPENVSLVGVKKGADMTLTFLDEFGDETSIAPDITRQGTKLIVAVMAAQYSEDGEMYGVAKWAPGDYDQMMIMVVKCTEEFQGGEVKLVTDFSCGQDTRPEVDENRSSQRAGEGISQLTVEGAGPVEPEVTEKPAITWEEVEGGVQVTATGNGHICLYVEDILVAEGEGTATYFIESTELEEEYGVSATAQEEGKEVSEYAVETVYVPGLPVVPEVTATPEIKFEINEEEQYVDIWAEGEGTIKLYIDGFEVANHFHYAFQDEEDVVVVTATAQEEGKEISETAEMEITIPAKPVVPQPEVTATPTITVDEDYNLIVEGEGEIHVYVDGEEVELPYTFEQAEEDVTYVITATAQEEGKEISEVARYEVTIPGTGIIPEEPYETPAPVVTVEETEDAVVITATGEGVINIYVKEMTRDEEPIVNEPVATGEGEATYSIMKGEEAKIYAVWATAQRDEEALVGISETQYVDVPALEPVTPEDPHATGYWLVTYTLDGEEVWDQFIFDKDNYTMILPLDYDTYGTFAYPIEPRPNIYFRVVANGVDLGAVEENTLAELGNALLNPTTEGDNLFYLEEGLGHIYNMGLFIDPNDGQIYVYAAIAGYTDVTELNADKAVAGVRYFNMAGQEMQEANGVTIVVTTYTDGTTSAVKVMK
jgi:hypothetical protein